MKKCVVVPADSNNLRYFEMLKNSLRKFHSEEELPLFTFDNETGDPLFFYRAAPYLTKKLMEQGYDTVLKLDADSIITGRLDHIWEGDYDIAVVQNSNPRELRNYPVTVLDLNPLQYVNCGFIVMKNKKLVDHWWRLCNSSHFDKYQMREQDLLNIMLFYGDYKYMTLDLMSWNKWHGLISKGYWNQIEPRDDKLILPKNNEWPQDADKEIVCIHVAGGNNPNKMRLGPYFKPEVLKYLEQLTGGSLR